MSDGSEVLNVGIDLGTSRSAVSASNGERHVVESYVGWPRDMVARKVLKRDVLVGTEAVENRTMLRLHRPLERGLIKEGSQTDVEAVRVLLDHLLQLAKAREGKKKARVRAVVGIPAEAMRVNKQQLRGALKDSVDSLMIVSEPFAVAYGLDALLHTLIVDLGAGTSDFCLMRGHFPTEEDQRTLTNAGDSVDDYLLKLITSKYPDAQVTRYMVREWKEKHGFVGEAQGKVVVKAPVRGTPTEIDITHELKTACESIVEPIVETMLDLIPRVEPEFQETVRNNVVLSGGSSLIKGLRARLQDGLAPLGGGKVQAVKDPVFAGSDGCLAVALDAPDSDWEQLAD